MPPHVPHLPDQPILNVAHVFLRYDRHTALEDITFHLHSGERVAVVGPNGAGKSTLFKIVAGVLPPSEGEVTVYGSGPGGHVCIGYLPQRSQVDWRFPVTVADVVMMGRIAKLGLFRWPRKQDWDLVFSALETVGLANLAKRQIGELSGGQQQRMFIARALAQEAELMLMDEPLTGLDTPAQESLLALLEHLQQRGVTVMVATHDLEQARLHFDRILLLNRRLIAFGPPEQVLQADKLVRAYGGHLTLTEGHMITDSCCEGDEYVDS
ncbi:MAG: metal ABC transporter ATP-binding protein [Anaerolineales bacterium]|nr:metal ABC transporter ATP-binding protein [Anaerolineales bacterium]MDW8228170.1 metal ABC transporter ATP-binding protein [Anaerolineales bacterium]